MELNDQLKELVSEISPTDSQQSALRDAPYPSTRTPESGRRSQTVDSRKPSFKAVTDATPAYALNLTTNLTWTLW